ncbi:hypothetical protein D3875_04045 [Deinococcus cavernae]|uniref:Uncharacterized protein n=1 Tax=Deinococcus cavernae TaxID=2320857 RepID=A0A418VEF9_9DEIO|nr:hypothetical protein [Deinococcus cavernae]RJF74458.1 hypothetical protein D3875_04045 [Deinococcus cavernae]
MIKPEQYNVVEAFPFGGRWYHPGQKFPPEGVEVSDDTLKKYDGVYLLTDKALTRRDNPQAHAAQTELERAHAELAQALSELEQTQAQIQELQGRSGPDLSPLLNLFLNEDGSPPTFEQAVDAAQHAQASVQVLQEAKDAGGDVDTTLLTDLFPEVSNFEDAVQEVMALQARVKTFETLHPTQKGTDLPTNFVGIGKLRAFGLTTYESLQGKTPEQLDAIEGLTLEKAQQIVDKVSEFFEKTEREGGE